MESNLTILQGSMDELLAKFQEMIRREIADHKTSELEARLLSPEETCKLFNPKISKVTLNKWTKDGHIQETRIGGRVYYKLSEVMESAKTLKRYKRN